MTLNDMIVSALAQLDRGHDAQSLDTWRDKFARFANEAVNDLFISYQPRRTEAVALNDNVLDTAALSHECVKVLSVLQNGKPLRFHSADTGSLKVEGAGSADVTYIYAPREMTSPADTPELPEWMHGLVVCYIVARERASGDASLQRGCNIYFQMYEAGKRSIRPHLGDPGSYKLLNRW